MVVIDWYVYIHRVVIIDWYVYIQHSHTKDKVKSVGIIIHNIRIYRVSVYMFITHLIFRVHYFPIHKPLNNIPYFTSVFFDQV